MLLRRWHRHLRGVVLIALCLLRPSLATLIYANDRAANDEFGYALSIASNDASVAVGARHSDGKAGAVYMFTGSTGEYLQAQRIPSQTGDTSRFGSSVALIFNGSVLLVGSPGSYSGLGAAYALPCTTGAVCSSGQPLIVPNLPAGSALGSSIAASDDGTVIAVGAPGDSGSSGAVYTFLLSSDGGTGGHHTAQYRDFNGP
jgi:hypothetical protein